MVVPMPKPMYAVVAGELVNKVSLPTEILDEKLEKYFYLWHKDKAPT